jgi:hypothetical protein
MTGHDEAVTRPERVRDEEDSGTGNVGHRIAHIERISAQVPSSEGTRARLLHSHDHIDQFVDHTPSKPKSVQINCSPNCSNSSNSD